MNRYTGTEMRCRCVVQGPTEFRGAERGWPGRSDSVDAGFVVRYEPGGGGDKDEYVSATEGYHERWVNAREQLLIQRERLVEVREQLVTEREQEVELREQLAGERDQTAEGRGQDANERDQVADQREVVADEREQITDLRDERAD